MLRIEGNWGRERPDLRHTSWADEEHQRDELAAPAPLVGFLSELLAKQNWELLFISEPIVLSSFLNSALSPSVGNTDHQLGTGLLPGVPLGDRAALFQAHQEMH